MTKTRHSVDVKTGEEVHTISATMEEMENGETIVKFD